jgi:hypothetical protein
LQQSKKLAEILPLESADMCYMYLGTEDKEYEDVPICAPAMEGDLCAWSLAALIGVLPYGYSSILTKSFNGKDYYCNLDGKHIEIMADNPVDACVAMIEKLHELKML